MTQEKMSLEPGARFKTRVVVKEAGKDKFNNTLYLTRCDCGYEQIYRGSYLQEERSCKMCRDRGSERLNSERKKPEKFIGKTFGELTLISVDAVKKNNKSFATFNCSCGKTVYRNASEVLCGTLKSCGCLKVRSSQIGKRVGMFVVVSKSHRDVVKRRTYYNCICDCGKEFLTESAELHNGKKTSCGCSKERLCAEKLFIPDDMACKNRIYGAYKRAARKRDLLFDLSKAQFIQTMESNCFYCGIEPSAVYNDHYGKPYLWNGVDRVDSSKGYVPENTVPCCKHCNYAKRDLLPEQFRAWIKRVFVNYIVGDKIKDQRLISGLLDDIVAETSL